MPDDPAFIFYPGDYLRDTQCLSEKTQVAYDRIMCEHMRNICISQQQLKFFTKRLSEDEKEELLMVLTKVNSGFQIKWVAESIEKRRKYSESRRENRKGKKKDMTNISKSYVPHMENEDEIENINEFYNEALKTWNFFAGKYDLSKIIKLSDKRKGNIKARFREKEFDLITVLKAAEKQPFLLGDNKEGWGMDFDWIFGSQNNYLKVLEKKYTEKNNGTHKSVITEDGLRRISEGIKNDPRYT